MPDDLYRITVLGGTGLADAAGNPFNGGNDDSRDLLLDAIAAEVTVSLADGQDTGVSDSDRLTSIARPEFTVVANESGRLAIDFGESGQGVVELDVIEGITTVQPPFDLSDGDRSIGLTLTPGTGSSDTTTFNVSIDTVGPKSLVSNLSYVAPWTKHVLRFDEPIDPSTLTVADVQIFGATTVTPDLITAQNSQRYEIQFAEQRVPRTYDVVVQPTVTDLAGNALNQDGDSVNGEAVEDVFTDSVTVGADVTGPMVISVTPRGLVNQDVATIRVEFNESINAATFEPEDVALTGPDGNNLPTNWSISAVNETTFDVALPSVLSAEGVYGVSIGPQIEDQSGNEMAPSIETQIYSTDFEIGVDGVWSRSERATHSSTTSFLGRFSNHSATLSLDNLPQHSRVRLVWDLLIIDSWDGDGSFGPDYWGFNVNGRPTPEWEYTFHTSGSSDSFPGLPDVQGDWFVTGRTFIDSLYQDLTHVFEHDADDLAITFFGRNLQGIGDESWGNRQRPSLP